LRDRQKWGLKRTILLRSEGMNLFVAGAAAEIDRLLLLRSVPGLKSLEQINQRKPLTRFLEWSGTARLAGWFKVREVTQGLVIIGQGILANR
jgi:hypothetical protein